MDRFLRLVGMLSWAASVVLLVKANGMDVTVIAHGGEVANLQLMQVQLMQVLLGGFAFLNGSVMVAAGEMLGRR
jgi:hypothetical protein